MEKQDVLSALAALAQETRLDAYRLLVQAGPAGLAAGAIAERLGVAGPTLSFHLKELKGAGVVGCRRRGRSLVYAADFGAMRDLLAYLSENCCREAPCAPTAQAQAAPEEDPCASSSP